MGIGVWGVESRECGSGEWGVGSREWGAMSGEWGVGEWGVGPAGRGQGQQWGQGPILPGSRRPTINP